MDKLSLFDRIVQQSQLTPNNTAVLYPSGSITYKDLLDKASIFANYFLRNEVQPNEIVCILMERSVDMIACTLGVLQAGGAYMHLNPAMPHNQLSELLEVLNTIIVIDEKYETLINHSKRILKKDIAETYKANAVAEIKKRNQEHLAYLVYTTGTSGNQKVIMVEDKNIIQYVDTFCNLFNVSQNDRSLQQSPCYYDGFAEEVFSMLFKGGAIVLAHDEELSNPRILKRKLEEFNVTIMATTPLMLSAINAACNQIDSVRCFISSGDVLKAKQFYNLIKHTKIYNMYGPSETTVCATYYECSGDEIDNISIGRPIAGYIIIICDENGQEVKDGERGEIYIGGQCVARGYLKNDSATSEAFVQIHGQRMYRTGDLGIKHADGNIEFCGRRDQQIKIHGRRVSIGDIEKTLFRCPLVQEIAIITKEMDDDKSLLAFCISSAGDISLDLQKYAKEHLADYMIPQKFVCIDKFPLTKTGKLDKAALLSLENPITSELHNDSNQYSEDFQRFFEKMFAYLNKKLGLADIHPDVNLIDIGINSLNFVALAVFIESEYEFEFDDEMLNYERFETFADLYQYIVRKSCPTEDQTALT